MFRRILLLLALGAAAAATASGEPAATVIGGGGEAFYKGAADDEWRPARVGDALSSQAVLRTATGGSVVLLRADGALVRVQEGRERALSELLAGAEQPQGARFFEVLREFFADTTMLRHGASRGNGAAGAGDLPQRLREPDAAQREDLLGKPRLARDDIPLVMDSAAYFGHVREYDKVAVLLDKLNRDVGPRPGFAPMAENARMAAAQRTWLRLRTFVDGETSPMAPDATLRSGNGVQIAYGTGEDRYLHVVLYSVSEGGRVSRLRVHPQSLTAVRPVRAGTELRLPSQGAFYMLDDQTGTELVVAWSCSAPMDQPERVGRLESAVAARLRTSARLTEADVLEMAPQTCSRAFVRAFAHVK